jgi:hypothetical protein
MDFLDSLYVNNHWHCRMGLWRSDLQLCNLASKMNQAAVFNASIIRCPASGGTALPAMYMISR